VIVDARRAWERHLPPGTDVQAFVARLSDGTLPTVAADTAQHFGDKPALIIDGEQITHARLSSETSALAAFLARRVNPGDRVVLCARNSIAMVVAYLAVMRAGGVVVLASPMLTRDELAYLAADSGTQLALGDPSTHERLLQVDGIAVWDVTGDEVVAARRLRIAPPDVTFASDDPAVIAYTSGTTGRPKGAVLSHGNLLASIRAVTAAWRWSPTDVLLHALPLTHQHGLTGLHSGLLTGSTSVILSAFDEDRLVQAAVAYQPTVFFAVPAVYQRMIEQSLADLTAATTFRLIVSGSAPLSVELAHRIAAVAGQIPLERYGTTESGMNISNPYDGPRIPGTIGLPLPGVEIDLAALDGAKGNDPHRLVRLRGPQVFSGYWQRPDATRESVDADRWFSPGDTAVLDERSGHLMITGRTKDLIISGGLNVYPAEVELTLLSHPSVADVAVAGVPSDEWGETVTAFVVAASGPVHEADLIAHAREHLAPYKCPKRIIMVSELPRNQLGKVERGRLVDDLLASSDGRSGDSRQGDT
jgi:malonyl-CoA/methylmalonyl-CoA synthetase